MWLRFAIFGKLALREELGFKAKEQYDSRGLLESGVWTQTVIVNAGLVDSLLPVCRSEVIFALDILNL